MAFSRLIIFASNFIIKKNPSLATRVFIFKPILIKNLGLEVRNVDHTVVQATIFDQLLAISGHDALIRCKAIRI